MGLTGDTWLCLWALAIVLLVIVLRNLSRLNKRAPKPPTWITTGKNGNKRTPPRS